MTNDAKRNTKGAVESRRNAGTRPRRTRTSRLNRTRPGRALVECIVSIFLLAAASLASAVTVNGSLALADGSQLVTRAQALAVTRVEDALMSPCATSAAGVYQLPRVNLLWQQSGSTASTSARVDVSLDRSPLGQFGSPSMQLSLFGGGVCP